MGRELVKAYLKLVVEKFGARWALFFGAMATAAVILVSMTFGSLGLCGAFEYFPFKYFAPISCSAEVMYWRQVVADKDRVIASAEAVEAAQAAENSSLKAENAALKAHAADAPASAEAGGWQSAFHDLQKQNSELAAQCQATVAERDVEKARADALEAQKLQGQCCRGERPQDHIPDTPPPAVRGGLEIKPMCLSVPSGHPGAKVRLWFSYEGKRTSGSATIQTSPGGPQVCVSMLGRDGLKTIEAFLKNGRHLRYDFVSSVPHK